MRTTLIYRVQGGYMTIGYRHHGFAWTITVPDYKVATKIAFDWRRDGVRPKGARS